MGNAAKKLYSKQEYLYYHLNRKEYDKIDLILAQNPELLEKPITKDTKHTLLMRAAFIASPELVNFILEKNPNVNATAPNGDTALSIAVRRNNFEIVQKLVEKGAQIDHNLKEVSILDLAILPGFEEIASYLYAKSKSKQLKTSQEYEVLRKKYLYRYVNYETFLNVIKGNEDYKSFNKEYLKKQREQLIDPVPDPRESWGQWFKRNLQFKDPVMVQRSSLPLDLQPQNRGWKGKADIALTNWSRIDTRKKSHFRPKFSEREVMSQISELQAKKKHNDYESAG